MAVAVCRVTQFLRICLVPDRRWLAVFGLSPALAHPALDSVDDTASRNESMNSSNSYRPRVSRETRLLLTTALVALAALWVLARIRFPDLPARPNPVAPLLSQIVTAPTFEDLASDVAELQARLGSSLIALDAGSVGGAGGTRPTAWPVAALRLRSDLAIAFVPGPLPQQRLGTHQVVASDAASGLVVLRTPSELPAPALAAWAPRRLERPRFLMVTDASTKRVTLRPVFVASLDPIATSLWPDPLWTFPETCDIVPGSFVFTAAGELAGLVIEYAARRAIVPSGLILGGVERLLRPSTIPAGDLGIHVQTVTADVSSATGAAAGVVVTWVDDAGPAARDIGVGDVIEAADGRILSTTEDWRVRLARLRAGETLALRVRRRGELQDVQLRAPVPPSASPINLALGLRMRRASRSGAEILSVEPASAAARAGLAARDVITLVGEITSPTPVQVRTAFAEAPDGKPVLVGVTRGTSHFVTTLPR